MACFVVPAAEAVATTIIKRRLDKTGEHKSCFAKRMNWLNNMLWGGSALLAFEHLWHGEITPWFPFLTNASSSSDAACMLFEMGTSGVGMAMLVTAVWAGIAAVSGSIEKRADTIAIMGGQRR